VKIPADDLEVTVHDTRVSFLQNLSAAVEDIECSEQLQTALGSVINEGHAAMQAIEFREEKSVAARPHLIDCDVPK
jgi:hypothetical protein